MNVYEQANKAYFDELKSLVDTSSKWALQVNAKGKKRLLERGHKPKYAHLKIWIGEVTPLLADSFYTIMTKVYWIINGIRDWDDPRVRCGNCGRPFIDKNVVNTYVGYFTYCSVKCQSNSDDIKNKIAVTNFDRYGGHHSALKAVQEKSKKTRLDKYGNETYNNTEKATETRKERFDGNYAPLDFTEKCRKTKVVNGHPENWTNSEQAVETRITANGGKYESPETDLKRRETCMERFGVEYSFQSDEVLEKSRITCLDKYGVKYYNQTDEFKEKSKQTCLDRYGVEHPQQCREIRLKSQRRYSYNGVCFDSAPELAYYMYLEDAGADFEYQPGDGLEYEYDGERHRYFPDFRVGDSLVEIKGDQFLSESGTWLCPWDRTKDGLYEAKRLCALGNGVEIMHSADYGKYLEYAEGKYGPDWADRFRKPDSDAPDGEGSMRASCW